MSKELGIFINKQNRDSYIHRKGMREREGGRKGERERWREGMNE